MAKAVFQTFNELFSVMGWRNGYSMALTPQKWLCQ